MSVEDINALSHGVKMVEPPPDRLPSILDALNKSKHLIPEGRDGVIVGVVNETGANLAFVSRVKGDITVKAWIGKEWKGSTDYGVMFGKEISW